ncbi:ion channel [Marinobacter sp. 2_MG-2023]|uniref:ion channel n=1 Tax=Marinobacter sp. 2_MG-2023 TaxID=3062679 RepID=UPI0026E2B5C5|nr:ion channel [Marinobacter sp. 2_MG-2023]MDO6440987.1 ion channel [Marinobacter sp. 2_MG-2023]
MATGFETVAFTVAGILIVAGVWLDFIATAMTASSTGTLSRFFSHGVHRFFKAGSQLFRSSGWSVAAGPCITLSLILLWFGLSWLGWSLVYLGSEGAIVSSTTRLPAQSYETVYYVGFALTTLGTGDFIPSSTLWRLVSVATAFNGLVLVTSSITYAIPVIQATAAKRALSLQFAIWGDSVESVRRHIESDRSYSSLTSYLESVPAQILLVAQNHLAYPVLHYFHSPASASSLALQIAVLDEVLRDLPDEAFERQPELYVLVPNCTRAITEFLTTLSRVFIKPAREEPPGGEGGNSTSIARRLTREHSTIAVSERRKLLKALVEENGWSWEMIHAAQK